MPNHSTNFRGGAENVPRVPPFVKATNCIKMFNCKFALISVPAARIMQTAVQESTLLLYACTIGNFFCEFYFSFEQF